MKLEFTKMQGLGNDFVVIDAVHQAVSLDDAQIRTLADRHLGVGCDQLLLVEPADRSDVDFRYRIFNADGGEVEQCGNGARCFARFVAEKGLSDKQVLKVATSSGVIELAQQTDGQVSVNMGVPDFRPDSLPFNTPEQVVRYQLDINGQLVEFGAVSMGNPHIVLQVDDVDQAPVRELGALLESHPAFPNRVNVGFMQHLSDTHLRLRVFERGVGETRACGTGACAAMAVARQQGLVSDKVQVTLTGGELQIHWKGEGHPLYMTGPAVTVFEGHISL